MVEWGQESGERACGDAGPCAPASGAYEKVITFDGGSGTLAGARAGKKGPVDRLKMRGKRIIFAHDFVSGGRAGMLFATVMRQHLDKHVVVVARW